MHENDPTLSEEESIMIRWNVNMSKDNLMMLRKGGSIRFFSHKELKTVISANDLKELCEMWIELSPPEFIMMYEAFEESEEV